MAEIAIEVIQEVKEVLREMTTEIALLKQQVSHLNNLRPDVTRALNAVTEVAGCVNTMQEVWSERRINDKAAELTYRENVKDRFKLLWGMLSAMVLGVAALAIKTVWGA